MITSAFRHLSQIGTVLLTVSVAVPSPRSERAIIPVETHPVRGADQREHSAGHHQPGDRGGPL